MDSWALRVRIMLGSWLWADRERVALIPPPASRAHPLGTASPASFPADARTNSASLSEGISRSDSVADEGGHRSLASAPLPQPQVGLHL